MSAPPKATPMPTSTQLPTSTPAPIAVPPSQGQEVSTDTGYPRTPAPIVVTPSPTAPQPVAPTIRVIFYNTSVTGDENFTVRWQVSGGMLGDITHSAVHWGFRSGGADIKDYGRFSKVLTGKTPQEFSVELKAPASGPIYFRAHALVDGVDVYTPEYQIAINPRYTGGGGGY